MSSHSLKSPIAAATSPEPVGQASSFKWKHLCLIATIILGVPSLVGQGYISKRGFDQEPANKLRKIQPHCVLVGDSMLETRIDSTRLSNLSKLRAEAISYPGTGTAQWYLVLKNYVSVLPKSPGCAIFFFRDRQLTLPAYHTTGRYRRRTESLMTLKEKVFNRVLENTGHDQALLTKLAKRLYPIQRVREEFQEKILTMALSMSTNPADAKSVQSAAWKMFEVKNLRADNNAAAEVDDESNTGLNPSTNLFKSEVDGSFLPEIISLARSKNIRLVFFCVKRRPYVKRDQPDPGLDQYIGELTDYLTQNGATLINETKDPELTVDWYTTDDHISQPKMRAYTDRFWTKHGSIIERVAHESMESNPL